MKKTNKKIIIAVSVLLIVALAIFSAVYMQNIKTVSFTDSSGNEIGCVKYNGKDKKIKAVEIGYSDYINLAFEEAISFYAEKNNIVQQNAIERFFENVAVVKTNFGSFYYEKMRDGVAQSGLESDTPFATVMVDASGRVLASYGYTEDDDITYSLHKTYAGSSIKPLSVYGPALEKGIISWSDTVKDKPIKKIKLESGEEQEWPLNANGSYTGENVLICDAVYKSTNTVAVRVLKELGVKASMDFLTDKLGINLDAEKKVIEVSDEEEIYGNIALGYLINGVSPLDMAGYYQIFLNGGRYTKPYAVKSVEDVLGNIIEKKPESERVISVTTATIMTKLLQGVVKAGSTGAEANIPGVDIAGKTGTSEGNYDNWFIGYNIKFVCAVWHGYNDESKNSSHTIFRNIFKSFPETDSNFRTAKGVNLMFYCKKSGGIKTDKCYDSAIGYYIEGKIPGKCKTCG